MKVLRWSVTEPKNQDLSCPLRHHPDDLLRPDLVQLLQEAQPHQVRRIFCTKKYFALRKISSNYLLRYLDVLYAEDGEDSEELPYVPEVKSSNNNQFENRSNSFSPALKPFSTIIMTLFKSIMHRCFYNPTSTELNSMT